MARIGHASAAAALRYLQVIGDPDAEIVQVPRALREDPSVPSRACGDAPVTHHRSWTGTGHAGRSDEASSRAASP